MVGTPRVAERAPIWSARRRQRSFEGDLTNGPGNCFRAFREDAPWCAGIEQEFSPIVSNPAFIRSKAGTRKDLMARLIAARDRWAKVRQYAVDHGPPHAETQRMFTPDPRSATAEPASERRAHRNSPGDPHRSTRTAPRNRIVRACRRRRPWSTTTAAAAPRPGRRPPRKRDGGSKRPPASVDGAGRPPPLAR